MSDEAVKKMNLGCGFDIKDGWLNVDNHHIDTRGNIIRDFALWDIKNDFVPDDWLKAFDFILINHVICTMRPDDANLAIHKAKLMLKPGGKLQIIDMDMRKAIDAFQNNRSELLPVRGDTIDEQFLMHVSGYGTRLSLYTEAYLTQLLKEAHGFSSVAVVRDSEYDLRPDESLTVEATK